MSGNQQWNHDPSKPITDHNGIAIRAEDIMALPIKRPSSFVEPSKRKVKNVRRKPKAAPAVEPAVSPFLACGHYSSQAGRTCTRANRHPGAHAWKHPGQNTLVWNEHGTKNGVLRI